MTGNPTNRSTQMIAMEGFDILDLKGFNVEFFQAEQGDGVVHCETEGVGGEEVGGAGEGGGGGGVLGGLGFARAE